MTCPEAPVLGGTCRTLPNIPRIARLSTNDGEEFPALMPIHSFEIKVDSFLLVFQAVKVSLACMGLSPCRSSTKRS